jgi:hypothetical protein
VISGIGLGEAGRLSQAATTLHVDYDINADNYYPTKSTV